MGLLLGIELCGEVVDLVLVLRHVLALLDNCVFRGFALFGGAVHRDELLILCTSLGNLPRHAVNRCLELFFLNLMLFFHLLYNLLAILVAALHLLDQTRLLLVRREVVPHRVCFALSLFYLCLEA